MGVLMKKLIIIPAYNEEENIERTIRMIEKGTNDFDYVIINDCSKDNTKKICEKNHFNYVVYLSFGDWWGCSNRI